MPEKEAQLSFSLKGLVAILLVCAFLLCMLIPAILNFREKSRQATCANNMKEIGLHLHNYHNARKYFPGSGEFVHARKNAGGFGFLFKTIIWGEYDTVYEPFYINPTLLKNTTSHDAKQVIDPLTHPDIKLQNNRNAQAVAFLCPSNPNEVYEDPVNKKVAFTNYKGMGATSVESLILSVNPNAVPPYGKSTQHPDGALYPTNTGIPQATITDGLSHTVMVVETIDDSRSCWLAGADATLVGMPIAKSYNSYMDRTGLIFDAPLDYNGSFYSAATPNLQAMRTYLAFDFRPGRSDAGTYPPSVGRTPAYGPSSGHPGIVNHLFCDGSVHSLRKEIDYAAYFFLITRANGDTTVPSSNY